MTEVEEQRGRIPSRLAAVVAVALATGCVSTVGLGATLGLLLAGLVSTLQHGGAQVFVPSSIAVLVATIVLPPLLGGFVGNLMSELRAPWWVTWGAGPRATQYLVLGGKARAVLDGRYAVTTDDVKSVAHPVLRHRVITNFNAESEGVTPDSIIQRLLNEVPRDAAKKLG